MRWMTYGAMAVGLLAACNGDKGEVTPTGETGDTDTTDPRCPNALLESFPEDGANGVYAWSSMDLLLSRSDAGATIVVTDDDGTEVTGSLVLTEEDKRLTWTPSGPMAAGAYTWTLEWTDCETRTATFNVSDVGTTLIADPSSLIGKTYVLDLTESRFVAPENIGEALTSQLEVRLLLGVVDVDDDGVHFMAGAEELTGGSQSLDAPTTRFAEAADFSENPRFTGASDALGLVVEGDPITVTDLEMTGSFAADGSAIEGFRMRTILDMRDLKDALDLEDDNGPCDLFSASFAVQCTACPNGAGDFCIDLVVADLTLPDAGYTMVEVP